MPCDQIQYQSVNFELAKNHEDLLAEALRAAGYTVNVYGKSIQFSRNGVSGSYSNGCFQTTGGDFDVDEVKRHFGKSVVKHAAKKYGWSLVTDKNGKMKLRKRI